MVQRTSTLLSTFATMLSIIIVVSTYCKRSAIA